MSLGFKFIKSSTWEEFIGISFMLAKSGCCSLFWFADTRACIFYLIWNLIVWLVFKMPKFNGKSKLINQFKSSTEFYEDVLEFEENELVIGVRAEKHYEDLRKKKKKMVKAG